MEMDLKENRSLAGADRIPGAPPHHTSLLPVTLAGLPPTMLSRYLAIAVIALGAAVLSGWALDNPLLTTVLPGHASMKANTALCFLLFGGALLALTLPGQGAERFSRSAAALVLLITFSTLVEYFTAINLGLDEFLFRDLYTPPELNPGRMSRATAMGFLIISIALFLLQTAKRSARLANFLKLLVLTVIIFASLALLGHVFGLNFFIYAPLFETVSLLTAAGFMAVGFGVLIIISRQHFINEGQHISLLSMLLLIFAAGTAGIASFSTLGQQVQNTLAQGLDLALDARIKQILTNIELRKIHADTIASRPNMLKHLRFLIQDPANAMSRSIVAGVLESYKSHGFSGISVTSSSGIEVARTGKFIIAPELVAPLKTPIEGWLVWKDSVYLRHRLILRDSEGPLGFVETEQLLPTLTGLLTKSSTNQWNSAEFQLCLPKQPAFECFPTNQISAPTLLQPRASNAQIQLAYRAYYEGPGFSEGIGYRGQPVLGAYDRVGNLGLVAVLKVDADEIYAPITERFAFAMLLTLLFAALGSYLVHVRVRPLATKLEFRVQERTAELQRVNVELQGLIQERTRLEARFREIIESSPSGMVMINQSGQIVLVNAEAEKLFGYSRNELLEQNIETLIPERYRSGHQHYRTHFMSAPEARRMGVGRDLYGLRKDGSEFPVEIGLSPVRTTEEVFVLSTVVDITVRKQAEERVHTINVELEQRVAERTATLEQTNNELKMANQELESYSYSVSHDLRAPLRSISGFSEILKRRYSQSLDSGGQHYLDNIIEAGSRMGRLIEDLLKYTRIGRQTVKKVPVHTGDVLQQVCKDLSAQIKESGAHINLPALKEMPVISGDYTLLHQICINLIGNAVTYFRKDAPGGPRVDVRCEQTPAHITLHFTDNGIGIAPGFHQKIFEMFQRLHSDEYPGTGIGLAIVKKSVGLLGGEISVTSTVGTGSTFSVRIPINHESREKN